MNTQIVKMANKAGAAIHKHAPEILTGCAVAGSIATTTLAITGTIKAVRLVDEKKKELGVDKLPAKEIFKTTWKCYIPMLGALGAASGCMIASTAKSVGRTALYAGLYEGSRTAFSEYKEKVKEVVGEKKAEEVENKVDQDKIEKNPPTTANTYFVDGAGDTLIYDVMNDRYFKSTWDDMMDARHRIIDIMQKDFSNGISLNDCYYEMGAKNVGYGDYRGYNTAMFSGDDLIDIFRLVPHMTSKHIPCFALKWRTEPVERYNMYY